MPRGRVGRDPERRLRRGPHRTHQAQPKDLEFVQVDLLNLASAWDENGIACSTTTPPTSTRWVLPRLVRISLEEDVDQRFSISLVARGEDEESEKIQVLKVAMTSDEARISLEVEYSDTLLPSF